MGIGTNLAVIKGKMSWLRIVLLLGANIKKLLTNPF
jgi:hypothetical protein